MSSWMGDWERGLINRQGNLAKYRTECKLGRHAILVDAVAVWLSRPMGLSCKPCILEGGVQEHLDALAAVETPVVKPEPQTEKGIRHGTSYAYNRLKCRCDLCRAANTEANARWRANRPKKAPAVAA